MSDPTTYQPGYSFSDFQSNSPTTPLPAPNVDNELANISTAIASLVASTKGVRSSDGTLKNGIVTFSSLSSALQLTVDPTNGTLVANAVAATQNNAALTAADRAASATSATNAANSANAAAASAATVNLSLYLAKANNLAGLGSLVTSRANLGLGAAATWNVADPGVPLGLVYTDSNARLPAYDGSLLINIAVVPVGTTIWTNAIVPPPGFLKENGALLSRASYPALWNFANNSGNIVTEATWSGGSTGAFSSGDLATTFRLPDMRGEFIRGYDDSRGVDSGRAIGAHQADLLKSHTHGYLAERSGGGALSGGSAPSTALNSDTAGTTDSGTGGAETRPRNNAKLACIKY